MLQYNHPSDFRLNLFRLTVSGGGRAPGVRLPNLRGCPLTLLTERLGVERGSVVDIFYPSGLQIEISKQRQQVAWECDTNFCRRG